MPDDRLPGFESPEETVAFTPTREAGLARLSAFAPRMGKHYAGQRNYDYGPARRSNVSALSPWIRHRLITEEEVLRATLSKFAPSTAEKFIQEVFWRTYFKGWLEHRPSVWTAYCEGRDRALEVLEKDRAMAMDYRAAIAGETGIDGFDQWARELVETGYLHNHARMWFASIWIFTLRLPWELGADFFLRHLLDGDPASNTLSWRWVAGLHTKGKTYQARVSNISKYTEGRFRPEYQLANEALPLTEEQDHPKRPIQMADAMPDAPYLLLVTEEDCRAEEIFPSPDAVIGLLSTSDRSPLEIGAPVLEFAEAALSDALLRASERWQAKTQFSDSRDWSGALIDAANLVGVKQIATAYAPIGPVATHLAEAQPKLAEAGLTLRQIRRDYDDLAWPHATKGFFALKQKIPQILRN
ncbi:MAG: FAD-binding domain-containing protein, partial [Pseudomonadota bacterium]